MLIKAHWGAAAITGHLGELAGLSWPAINSLTAGQGALSFTTMR